MRPCCEWPDGGQLMSAWRLLPRPTAPREPLSAGRTSMRPRHWHGFRPVSPGSTAVAAEMEREDTESARHCAPRPSSSRDCWSASPLMIAQDGGPSTRGTGLVAARIRPTETVWGRETCERCCRDGVSSLFKQLGEPQKKNGRSLDGRAWDAMPKNRLVSVGARRASSHLLGQLSQLIEPSPLLS